MLRGGHIRIGEVSDSAEKSRRWRALDGREGTTEPFSVAAPTGAANGDGLSEEQLQTAVAHLLSLQRAGQSQQERDRSGEHDKSFSACGRREKADDEKIVTRGGGAASGPTRRR